MKYSERVSSIAPSVTLAITAKAGRLKEEGQDVVGFGAGEPDFNTPQHIMDAACTAMKEGKTKYTPASGILPLKEAIARKLKQDNALTYDASQIIVSTGAKQCLANAFLALLNEGDEVLMAAPYWVSYPELVTLAGGRSLFIHGDPTNQYKLTAALIEEHITPKSKVLVLNSPNNPTGTIYSREELMAIAEVCKKHDLFILSDEMYEKLIYGSARHVSIASLSEDAYSRTLTINGVSKAYAMTGWRIGYAAGPAPLIKMMGSVQSHTTSNPCSISQYAALEAIQGPQDSVDSMIQEFSARRDLLVSEIEALDGIECIRPEGAFYVMMDIRSVLGKTYRGRPIANAMDFSDELLSDKLVAVVPGEGFGIEGFVRLSYATSRANIEKGMKRIKAFLQELE
ncbi:Aspartate aminotransferase [Clostridiaceae bacterium JG1575]|nr:Aspartate aminotransferase [Clostridiaceae bacterium JG1575]